MKITAIHSPIKEINSYVNLYAEGGSIVIEFKGELEYLSIKRIKEQLKHLCSTNNIAINSYCLSSVSCQNPEQFRVLIDLLFANNYINSTDRADCEEEIIKVEQTLINRTRISDAEPTSAQQDIMSMLAEPYLDELIEKTREYADIIPMLVIALTHGIQKENFSQWYFNKYQSELDQITLDCLTDLSKMARGQADLASTFLRAGGNIPSLSIHRKMLLNAFQNSASEKFDLESNEYKRFYINVSLTKLAETKTTLSKRLTNRYEINFLSGFPEEKIFKSVSISPAGQVMRVSSGFFSDKTAPRQIELSETEEKLLNEFDLKRFPVSEADLALAKKDITSSQIMKSFDDVLMAVDGDLHFGMSTSEKLYLAISTHNLLAMKALITEFEIDLDSVQEFNPLIVAADHNNLAAIEELIILGADVNFIDVGGETPLSRAAYRKNLPIIEYLVAHNAQISQTDQRGRAPLHCLFSYFRPTEQFDVHTAVTQLKLMIDLLSGHSLDMLNELVDVEGDNCLLIAAKNAHLPGIMALLELGASVDAKTSDGLTAYDIIFDPRHNSPLRENAEIRALLQPQQALASMLRL